MNTEAIRSHLEEAAGLVEEAGRIAARHFRRPLDVENKAGDVYFDPVTVADREVERFLRTELAARFGGYGIVGEEEANTDADAERCWVLDPIDGTRAFISGMPAWGILLGLTVAGVPLLGVMHQPYIGETFRGGRGVGAQLQRGDDVRAMRTRQDARLADAVLYSTHPDLFVDADERAAFRRVARACRMTRYGGDCYSYCLLAAGYVDLVVETMLAPYDIVPLIPIIEAAGGIVTGRDGGPATAGGFVVAAANPQLHAQTLAALAA
jgi:histidinol phosphatase-like enzyme (inositol monophosphatase family)